jgi:hypothetical protein
MNRSIQPLLPMLAGVMLVLASGAPGQQAPEGVGTGAPTAGQAGPDSSRWQRMVPNESPQWQTGQAPARSADSCSQCYRALEKNNADCESLTGIDWKVCRDAAQVAYKRCSGGC